MKTGLARDMEMVGHEIIVATGARSDEQRAGRNILPGHIPLWREIGIMKFLRVLGRMRF